MDKTTRMRSNGRVTKYEIERLHQKITVLEDKIAKLEKQKDDYLFTLGRALSGKKVHVECKSHNPDVMCITCDCWKKTRSNVG